VSDDPFLSRWSRLKKASKAAPDSDLAPPVPAPRAVPVAAPVPAAAAREAEHDAAPLPPLESLTPESDFSPFMRAKVEESVKRQALKTLFQDPRFNVMDGLDVYIGDYSVEDPLPDGWLEKMSQMAHLGDQPARVEAERKAAEEAALASADPPVEVKNSTLDAGPATPDAGSPSDTSDHDDEAPRVGVSQAHGPSLS
jgi:hypothetical protein